MTNKTQLTNFQLGPSVGYAYTWAIKSRFYISASIAVGISIGFNDHFENIMVYPNVIPRFATGYNKNLWGINLTYVNNLIYAYLTEEREIALNTGYLQINFIRHFQIDYKLFKKKYVIDQIHLYQNNLK